MKTSLGIMLVAVGCLTWATAAPAQETETETESETETEIATESDTATETVTASESETESETSVENRAEEIVGQTRERVGELAEDVDDSETAREASAGILRPIYLLAEQMSFPAFHWVAFTLMTAGVVGFALQLLLAKLVVLSKMGFSLTEILSDGLGLAISLFGLVLTTQAAAENSSFTQSPFAVLSATVAGVVFGLLHYRWGQAAEVQALAGRKQEKTATRTGKKEK